MGKCRNWTAEEIDYLNEAWGNVSIPRIAAHLNRSEGGVVLKAQRLRLGRFDSSGDYVTFNQLMKTIRGTQAYSYYEKSWIKNREFPIHKKLIRSKRVSVVYLEEFWKWAENNRSFIDFSRMEPLALGQEPEWVSVQRKKDFCSYRLQRKDPWTKADEDKLINLVKMHRYTYSQISSMMNRSEGAIVRRLRALEIKDRPIRVDSHEGIWRDEDYNKLAEGINTGESYKLLSELLNKSEKSIRGKVYATYFTESLDKVRAIINGGKWGENVPSPTIKQACTLSHYRTQTKRQLSELAGILRYRMNQLGYEPFFQKEMCMNWDENRGCLAGGIDCDSCSDFLRIRPQYCVRCGKTFFERQESKFCGDCRKARKKAAKKKYYALQKIRRNSNP